MEVTLKQGSFKIIGFKTMKPEDLKIPFKWDERCVLLQDRILYVPPFYDRYETYKLPDWKELFGNSHPIEVEYCSGNGAWIAAKAVQYPMTNWVAVERKFERVRKIWAKMINHKLNNLLVVCGEALTTSRHYFPASSLREIYINFPDPWPKKRHWKNRIIQPDFIAEVERTLLPGGRLTVVTDDIPYSEVILQEMAKNTKFSNPFNEPGYRFEYPGYGSSYFEDLWRSKGKQIRYHQFEKVT